MPGMMGVEIPPPTIAAKIDPPIDGTLITNAITQHAFGFDQLVAGYNGNTCMVQRSSDNATQSFGFDSTGRFNIGAVQAWAGASTSVTVTALIDQMGTAKTLTNTNTVTLISNGVVQRFGTAWNNTNSQLLPLNTHGGIGVPITSAGYLSGATSISGTSGLEFHMLTASLTRKIAANDSTDPAALNANNTSETYFAYGLGTSEFVSYGTGGGNFIHALNCYMSGGGGSNYNTATSGMTAGSPILKANGLNIITAAFGPNGSIYGAGQRLCNCTTFSGATQTAIAGLNNGTLVIGNRYPGLSAVYGNFLFGGIIITQTLTEYQRYIMQARLTQVAHQQYALTNTQLFAMFDEIVDMSATNTGTGVVVGQKSNLTLDYNLSTGIPTGGSAKTISGITNANPGVVTATAHGFTAGSFVNIASVGGMTQVNGNCYQVGTTTTNTFQLLTPAGANVNTTGYGTYTSGGTATPAYYPSWSLGTTVSPWTGTTGSATGLVGNYNPTYNNYANVFGAPSGNYFSNVTAGSLLVLGYRTYNSGNPSMWFSNGTNSYLSPNLGGQPTDYSIGMGTHHAIPNVFRKVAASLDSSNYTLQDGWVDNNGGLISESYLKYNINFGHGDWNVPQTATVASNVTNYAKGTNNVSIGTVLSNATLPTYTTAVSPTPEGSQSWNLNFPYCSGFLQTHIATFNPPPAYNFAGSNTARNPYMRLASNASYVAPAVGSGFGHLDASIALENGTGCVVHHNPASTIQSGQYLSGAVQGTAFLFGFSATPWTMAQAMQVYVNLYKFYTQGY